MIENRLSLIAVVRDLFRGTRPSCKGASALALGTVQKGVALSRITPLASCTASYSSGGYSLRCKLNAVCSEFWPSTAPSDSAVSPVRLI